MQSYKKWFSGAVALSVLVLGAMNLTSVSSRSAGHASYDRLLSKHYKRIAALEAEIGTYSHYQDFKQRSEKILGQYNPRPIIVRGNRELRIMRRDLERAMVGYEMRHNPDAVAGMHAAFECHVKNININNRLDRRCVKAFDSFRAKAERSADEAYNMKVAQIQPERHIQKSQPVIDFVDNKPVPKIESVPFVHQKKEQTKPPKKPEIKPQQKKKNTALMPIAPIAAKNTPLISKPKADTPKAMMQIPNVHKTQSPQAPKMQSAPEIEAPKATTGKSFDPLDYVHPRLRNAQRRAAETAITPISSEETLPIPSINPSVSKPAAYIEGTTSKVPAVNMQMPASDSFGIKPLSQIKMPRKSLFSPNDMRSTMAKIDMSMFEATGQAVKIKPHPRFLEQSLESSPEFTAAIDPKGPAIDRYVVPFTRGGTRLSKAAEMEIQRIGSKIQKDKFSQIRFVGHADKGGSSTVNRALSFERAANVHDALENIIKYVDIQKTSIDGLGDANPVRAFRPEDDRNRRVVVELVR